MTFGHRLIKTNRQGRRSGFLEVRMDENSQVIDERGMNDWASLHLIYMAWFVLGARFNDIGNSLAMTRKEIALGLF